MIIKILYEIALWILSILTLPMLAYQAIFYGKYRNSFFQRCGMHFPKIEKGNRPLIWIHAVSVGETKAVSLIVQSLKAFYDNPIILISSITETGHSEAKKSVSGADYHIYLPFDFYFLISPIVARVNPDMLLISENDCWYNFLHAAKKCGAFIALVNGKLSERSKNRFLFISHFAKSLFGCIDLFCVQSKLYLERFVAIGIPMNKIVVIGNLKFDDEPIKLSETDLSNIKEQWGITQSHKVLVIGSSHDPEERQLLDVIQKVWISAPYLKVIIVPRHPERFKTVAALLESMNIPFARYSQKSILSDASKKVILIDAMGMLRNSYQIADLAIVAGSFTEKIGGHNILEPLWFGVPTLFGPYMHSQPDLVGLVKQYSAGLQITLEDLESVLHVLLSGGQETLSLQRNGLELVASMRGSSQRTLKALMLALHK